MTDAPTCEQPSERQDGTLCGFEAESIVDVVRYEGDGESTFFTLPLCLGHRLALGEHVIHYTPTCGSETRRHLWTRSPMPWDRCIGCGKRYDTLLVGWHDVGPAS